jgi:hypothetical protein
MLNLFVLYPVGARDLGGVPVGAVNANVLAWAYFIRFALKSPLSPMYITDYYEGNFTGQIIGGYSAATVWNGERGFTVNGLTQSRTDPLSVTYLEVFNLDRYFTNAANTPGIKGTLVEIFVGEFDYNSVWLGSYKVFEGTVDDHSLRSIASITIKPHHTPWGYLWLSIMQNATCHNNYRGPYCKYAGAEPPGQVTCGRTRQNCADRSNLANYNGFDLSPKANEILDWGKKNV